jgi:hypothetical protein
MVKFDQAAAEVQAAAWRSPGAVAVAKQDAVGGDSAAIAAQAAFQAS